MYPNKAPPSAAPTMIPGEEPTKNKKTFRFINFLFISN